METYNKALYPFESKWVKIKGNKVHYIDEGKGQILLFCHPPISSSFMYREMISELSKHFRCIALDFPGFGLSQLSSVYRHSISSQSEIVDALIDHLKLSEITLLMQEVGGHAAMKVFIERPQLLKSIIITDTILFPVGEYPKIKSILNFVNSRIFRFININFNFFAWAMPRFGVRNRKLDKMVRKEYLKLFQERELRAATCSLLQELVKEEKLLNAIHLAFQNTFKQIPAFLIYGEKDPLAEFQIPQRTHQLLPHNELNWIKGEAHFPHEGAPHEMIKLILNFIKRQMEIPSENHTY